MTQFVCKSVFMSRKIASFFLLPTVRQLVSILPWIVCDAMKYIMIHLVPGGGSMWAHFLFSLVPCLPSFTFLHSSSLPFLIELLTWQIALSSMMLYYLCQRQRSRTTSCWIDFLNLCFKRIIAFASIFTIVCVFVGVLLFS